MYVSNNRERLQTISEVVRIQIAEHIEQGGAYYDERAGQIAARAIKEFMPELFAMSQQRLVVEADGGITFQNKEASFLGNGLRVEARLEKVGLQALIGIHSDAELHLSVELSDYDLFAVLRPLYVNPEPVEIVFSDAVMVPFEEIQLFEPVE